MIYHIDKLKKKNHMIVSIHAEKTREFQPQFMTTTLQKVGINMVTIIKAIYDKPIANIMHAC